MTDQTRPNGGADQAPQDAQPLSTREASFVASTAESTAGPTLDPAQESLANALRMTFRVVQFVMVLLLGAFLLSGFQTVGESERAIKLTFGKIDRADLEPGVQWSWPFPIGELVKVRTGQETIDITHAFMPELAPFQRARSWSQVAASYTRVSLRPGRDGSVVTADGALAHLECSITFNRHDPVANTTNVYSADETAIVRSAVERAVINVIAETTIDQFLRQAGTEAIGGAAGALESRVRRLAQEALDELGAGIRIDSVTLRDPRPPLQVFREFDAVAAAEAASSKEREDAQRLYRLTLNDVAGEAHEIILDRIDAYERALELGDEDANLILDQIHALLEGTPIEINGRVYENMASGAVTSILNDARQYRTDVVASARVKAETFMAKLPQYRDDPSVLVAADWRQAYQRFLDRGHFETMILPPDSQGVELMVSSDPDIIRKLEMERNRRQADQTIQERIEFLRERTRERTEQARREARERN